MGNIDFNLKNFNVFEEVITAIKKYFVHQCIKSISHFSITDKKETTKGFSKWIVEEELIKNYLNLPFIKQKPIKLIWFPFIPQQIDVEEI